MGCLKVSIQTELHCQWAIGATKRFVMSETEQHHSYSFQSNLDLAVEHPSSLSNSSYHHTFLVCFISFFQCLNHSRVGCHHFKCTSWSKFCLQGTIDASRFNLMFGRIVNQNIWTSLQIAPPGNVICKWLRLMTHWRHSKQASEQFVETMFFFFLWICNIPSKNRWNSFYRWDFKYQLANWSIFSTWMLIYMVFTSRWQTFFRVMDEFDALWALGPVKVSWRRFGGWEWVWLSIQDRCVWQVWGHVVWTQRIIYINQLTCFVHSSYQTGRHWPPVFGVINKCPHWKTLRTMPKTETDSRFSAFETSVRSFECFQHFNIDKYLFHLVLIDPIAIDIDGLRSPFFWISSDE